MTASEARWRGRWPSVRQTEQNEQCFGQPRTVCTEAHIYCPRGIKSQRALRKLEASTRPPKYMDCGAPLAQSANAVAQTTSPSPLTTACAPPRRCASSEYMVA